MSHPSVTDQITVVLRDYAARAVRTDRFPQTDLHPILLGLFGEVGGVMSTAKKLKREGEAFVSFRRDVEEEFGDTLWYFAALCRRVDMDLETVFASARRVGDNAASASIAGNDSPGAAAGRVVPELDALLVELGLAAASLLSLKKGSSDAFIQLVRFAERYLDTLTTAKVSLAAIIRANLEKVEGRFIAPDPASLPTFDQGYPEDERLPETFEIVIRERRSGQSCLQWNGVFIGDPLTDNIGDPDGYRFHDVFHFAHAAILHWSPTFRALIKHKRKSTPDVDEAQDGGRAIVVEEGLSAWVFSRAKLLNFFDGQSTISFDMLKGIREFVSGYEVEECPLKLWEDAILQGYSVFRQIRSSNGGVVIGDRRARRIAYKSL
jgi:NTP pyrophosphatase (non-canonical NTP hydrolase)